MHNFDFQLKKTSLIYKNIKTTFLLVSIFSIISICATAQNFTVNSNADTHAASPTTSALDGSGFITLRSAMEASTQIAGTHVITIPGSITTINLTLGQITVGAAAVGNNITLNGPGKTVLTINQTTVNRIFSTGLGAVTFSLNDLTLNYTGPAGTISGGGGAIIAGGINAVTSLTNVAINNFNIQIGNGGGISCSTSNINSLTLTNCDFNNNYAGGGGGAVSFNGNSTCVITNCKFTNNQTGPLGANTGGGGGALSTTGSGSGGTYTVSNCTFTNNHVLNPTAQGGAVINTNGALTVSFCRFAGNTAVNPALGNTIAQTGGATVNTINSDNNWWGQNAPTANDNVVLAAGGSITCTKWLQLKTSVSANPICAGGNSSIVTASFLSNSAAEVVSTGNISTLIGLPISFVNPVLGSLSGAHVAIQAAGTASVTYTSGASGGAGSVNAVVDNIPNNDVAPAQAAITVNLLNTINLTSAVGTNVQTKCINTAITNITYTTTGASGATFSGLPAGVTGGWTANVVTISGAPSAAGTFNYTVTLTGGCGTITATGSITVTPNNTISLTSAVGTNAQTKCINSAITNITYATTGATGATFSGLPTGVTGSWLANVATISGTPTASGNFSYIVTLTGGCGAINATGTIAVNPLPVVSISPAGPLTICTGTPTTLTASSTCNTFAFSGLLSGTQSVPSNPSTARGVFNGTYNASTNLLTLNVVFDGLTGGNASAAHIHTGAVGVNGGIIIPFTGFPATSSGTYSNTFTVPVAQIANFMAGNTYINIHNGVFPGGEIRGQVVNLSSNVYTFSGPMNGAQSVPPVVSTSTGYFAGTYNTVSNQLTLNLIFNNLTGGIANAGHIHPGAIGVNGGAIIPFTGLPAALSGSYTNVFTLPAPEIANFLAGNTYINIHNATYPAGEIRGQIAAPAQVCSGVTYSWSTGASTPAITVSSANTYIVTATDAGCSNTASVVVNVIPNNTINLTSTVGSNAQTVNVNTAITNITYATTGATSATISGLPTGVTGGWSANVVTISGTPTALGLFNYTVNLNGGCGVITAAGSITVNTGCAVIGSGTTTPTTCAGGSNGTATITLTGTGSGAPGTYTVDGGSSVAYSTNPFTITSLISGNHTIVATVTAGGCVSSNILVNVGTSATFTATYVKTNLSSCSGLQDGSITVTPTGGTAPYTYVWTGITGSGNPATTVYPNPGNVPAITGLNYGYYNVTITDAGGCGIVTFSNIHVEFAYAVYVTNSGSASSSCGNTGSVILYGNAGVIPYTYALVPGTGMPTPAPGVFQAGNTFTGLAAGPYTGFIKDAGGCVSAKNITVSAVVPIVVNPFATAASSCAPDGSIQVFRTGGIPPYTYSLNNVTYQTSNFFGGLAAGPYTAYVKDSKGCVGSQPATVAAGTGISATTSKVNTSTCVNDGTIQVNATGGIPAFMYSLNGGTYQASNSFNGLGTGNYTVQVKDSKGCLSPVYNITINLNTIVVTASATAAGSCASNNGSIVLFRTGGYSPYTYSLDGNIYQSSNTFTNKAAGTYSGFVKDFKGCVGMLAGIVVGPNCPPPPVAGTTTRTNNTALTTVKNVKLPANDPFKIEAYPNPSATEFTLLLNRNNNNKVFLTVTDLAGRKVYQLEGNARMQYKFGNNFNAGIYIVVVKQGNEKQTLKLVKE